jgi:sugar phosphate isomerase/epimerase
MKLAIESYCYHRFFGEWYPDIQRDPGRRMTTWDFLQRAHELDVAGVSLDAHYVESLDDVFLARLRETLDEYNLELVWGWGHLLGLHSGEDREAAKDLVRHLGIARRLGAKVMRICGGGWRTRPESWTEHKNKLVPLLRELIGPAEQHGVVMAMENHLDLTTEQMLEIMTTIDSPWLGVCLDTANNLRLLEDPVAAAAALASFARATHVKDLAAYRGNPRTPYFWPSVVSGEGAVDIPEIFRLLTQAGYSGLLALEIDYLHPKYGGDEDRAVTESVAYLRSLLD